MNEIMQMIGSQDVNLYNSFYKLFLSLILGALIGLERRQKGQVAGMRTFALISMGATLAMLVSIYIPQEYMGLKNGDPGRIAAQVISGVGFLGAGAIIQMKGSVKGLTTAASIWMTACIGLAVGSGMYVISTIACLMILVCLKMFEMIEKVLLRGAEQKIIRLKAGEIITDSKKFHDVFDKYDVHLMDEFIRYDYTQNFTTINFMVRTKDNTDFINLFKELHESSTILSLTLTNEVNN